MSNQRINFDGTPHVCSFNADGYCATHATTEEAPLSSKERSLLEEVSRWMRVVRDDIYEHGQVTGRTQHAGQALLEKVDVAVSEPSAVETKTSGLVETMSRVYCRLQCADVPRDPWHEEVCQWLARGSPPETSNDGDALGWIVVEQQDDGRFIPAAQAQRWELNKDAHWQRDDLAKRYPERLYAVRRAEDRP